MERENLVTCDTVDCSESIQNHTWGKIRAQDAGWYFSVSGVTYCPEHKPDWVDEWRRRKSPSNIKPVDSVDQW